MKKVVIGVIILLVIVILLFFGLTVHLKERPAPLPAIENPLPEDDVDLKVNGLKSNEYELCPASHITDFNGCAEYCANHVLWDGCRDWCIKNSGACKIKFVEPPFEKPSYWKIGSVGFWTDAYVDDIKEINEINCNMLMIFFSTAPLSDGSLDVYRDEPKEVMELVFARGIAAAHEKGMQVVFDLEVGGPEAIPTEKREIFLENYKEFVIDWAKFCEKHKVYAFNLNSELDNEFFVSEDCKETCKDEAVSTLAQNLLKEARKYYSGRIGVGILDTYSSDYNLTGYDFFTTNLPCGDGDVQGCLDFYGEAILGANALKKKYNVPKFIIGEVDIFSENDATPEGKEIVQGFEVVSEQAEADFYDKFFERYASQVDGITITYSDPLGIKTGPAKKVVGNWFKSVG